MRWRKILKNKYKLKRTKNMLQLFFKTTRVEIEWALDVLRLGNQDMTQTCPDPD